MKLGRVLPELDMGIGNSVFIALLAIIPIVNIVMILRWGEGQPLGLGRNAPGGTPSIFAARSAAGRSPARLSGSSAYRSCRTDGGRPEDHQEYGRLSVDHGDGAVLDSVAPALGDDF